jgi:hypothetical protein
MSFAVPKTKLEAGQRWEKNGTVYRVIGKRKLQVLGGEFDVDVIESKENHGSVVSFFYSSCYGLLAVSFEDPSNGALELFFSKSKFGYAGAPPPSP